MTQAQDFADLSQAYSAGNVALSNRNFIVDGAKEQWNIAPGASLPLTGGYGPCVLQLLSPGTSGVGSYSRGLAGAGPTGRFGWPRGAGNNYGGLAITTASTGTIAARTCPQLAMRVEDVNACEGGSFTFSVWLQAPTTPITITQISFHQNFGTGGSPSANVTTLVPINWAVDGTWRRFSIRLDIPNISGKTLGTTANTSWTQIEIDLPVNITYTVNDGFWQLEPCSPLAPTAGWPTAFEYRGQQAELARVQRYYEAGIEPFRYINGLTGVTAAYDTVPFLVQKRALPAMTLTGWKYYSGGGDTAFTPTNVTGMVLTFTFQGLGLTNWCGWDGLGTWVADARL